MTNQRPKHPILLSVVMVVRNVGLELATILREAIETVAPLVSDFEIVLVDNGSDQGDTDAIYAGLTQTDGLPNLQVYKLIRRVEFEVAAWAGVENSLGDYVFVFDPMNEDLSALPQALEQISSGCELVLLVNDTPWQRKTERLSRFLFRRLYRWISNVDLPVDASQCRLMSKRVVSYLLQHPKPAWRYRALPATAGFSRALIHYRAARRPEVKFGYAADLRRAVRLLLSNSIAPLRLASGLALTGAILNVIYSIYVVIITLWQSDVAAGWTTLSLQQSGMFFLISLVIFVLTEYLIHSLRLSMEGPPYFVAGEMTSAVLTRRERLNVETLESVIRREPEDVPR